MMQPADDTTYFFAQDSDSHWYKVPSDIRDEWNAWVNLPEPGDAAVDEEWDAFWTEPERAERLSMHPSNYNVVIVSEEC